LEARPAEKILKENITVEKFLLKEKLVHGILEGLVKYGFTLDRPA
jgi:hypothetical protein